MKLEYLKIKIKTYNKKIEKPVEVILNGVTVSIDELNIQEDSSYFEGILHISNYISTLELKTSNNNIWDIEKLDVELWMEQGDCHSYSLLDILVGKNMTLNLWNPPDIYSV